MLNIQLPDPVAMILGRLEEAGHEAYIVGGCVRDALLGIRPYDWDITTSAEPQEVKALFDKTIDTGLQHGTVTLLEDGLGYEVTTYRVDGQYEKNRKPVEVTFTRSLKEDLRRRDFTINAMAYNGKTGLVDLYGGLEDLENGLVRCVGNPMARFEEDALRMLRAVRFAARYKYAIEGGTVEAIKKLAHLIANISEERIHMELTKILCSNHPEYMESLVSFGLMEHLIPEFMPCVGMPQHNPYHCYTVDHHTYQATRAIEPTEVLRWTMFLHDIGKGYHHSFGEDGFDHFYGHTKTSVKLSKKITRRLRFDNNSRHRIAKLIELHDYRIEESVQEVRRALHRIGKDFFEDYIAVQRADIYSQHPDKLDRRLNILDNLMAIYRHIIHEDHCITLRQLAVSGHDLHELGIPKGAIMGQLLNQLLDIVLDEPEMNDPDVLKAMALELYKKIG